MTSEEHDRIMKLWREAPEFAGFFAGPAVALFDAVDAETTRLRDRGLLDLVPDEPCTWAVFTDAGEAYCGMLAS